MIKLPNEIIYYIYKILSINNKKSYRLISKNNYICSPIMNIKIDIMNIKIQKMNYLVNNSELLSYKTIKVNNIYCINSNCININNNLYKFRQGIVFFFYPNKKEKITENKGDLPDWQYGIVPPYSQNNKIVNIWCGKYYEQKQFNKIIIKRYIPYCLTCMCNYVNYGNDYNK